MKKRVHAELDSVSYSRLRRLCRMRDISIQEAITEYVSMREGEVEDDPLFSIVGALELNEDWSGRKDWTA